MDVDWNLGHFFFQVLLLVPAKSWKKILWLMLRDEICLTIYRSILCMGKGIKTLITSWHRIASLNISHFLIAKNDQIEREKERKKDRQLFSYPQVQKQKQNRQDILPRFLPWSLKKADYIVVSAGADHLVPGIRLPFSRPRKSLFVGSARKS